ncbi:putative Restriction endonuclease S subunit [Vibrio nigripulchritudo SFn27]|uniref:Putative Restriction endonuclease S subunit n=1 Tax=Vibrio nigripulchritudo TaxID=28173 RepID=U4K630_9VIBR|nr:restriction endonuclease subunit S [Vibrio nigripulchritudo]CCN81199.1 putative Restriction endonuclease S subunit [Vibrio nigripulchritudo BLFn1]CCN88721.1 putative Restriction endonuclease S subunit [Vibrio nigripulchritudo SFn27]CCN94634.1 putative Restriction endonuclease S subunit [Vibrio nigripulchritudo ENn2]CCO53569.1 putative Restriction endonuclease S subunit [Vibrio nigripulchritudo Wn13]CCO58109.1 putative Restriction endonuclease S subunit [Vibrio nigripulchritudo]
MSLETKTTKIKDLGKVITGGTPPTKQRQYYGNKVPLIKPTDMVLGQRYIGNTDESLSDIGVAKFKNKLVPANTPCIVTIGTIGKSCLTKEISLVNQAVNCVVVDTEKFDIMYVYYLLQLVIPTVKSLNSGTASGRENVSKSVFENIDVKVVVDKSKQAALGRQLSYYDSLIENNNRRIAILEEIAQSYYSEWFVNFDSNSQSEERKLVDSPMGKIPDGWEVKSAQDAITINPKTKLNKTTENPFVGMSGLAENSMVIDDIIQKKGNSGAKFINGDTLFARITPCLQNGKTGYVQFLTEEQPVGFGSTEFIVLRESEDLSSEFIYLLSRSNNFREHAIQSMTGATGRQRVHNDCFASFYIAVPPRELMDEFTSLVSPMFKSIFNLSKRNENLKKQRDMLLPKLILGEIEL